MESPNSLFIEYLTQLKKSAEEKGNQNGAKIYRKCISSMLLYPIPLWEAKEASILDGFGDKVCGDMQSLLEKHAQSLNLDPKQLLEYSRDVPDEWWEVSTAFKHKESKVAKAKRPVAAIPEDDQTKKSKNTSNNTNQSDGLGGSSEQGVRLICDNREVTGRGKTEMRKRMDKVKQFSVEYMTLNISDFCFLLDGNVRILIERKRIDDLASSIKDKRYAEQKSRLEECSKYRPFYLIEFKAWHGTMPLSTIHQAISNVFWIHNFNLIFTDNGEQTAKILEKIGSMLPMTDRNSTDGDIDLNELQNSSNRRQRVTKQVQLSRMLECIHGMTPNYAQKLASEFGTFKTMKRRIKDCENFDTLPINFLPNHLKKSLKLFFG